MCSSLTDQVRSIAVVTTAVARGDLTQKIEIQVEGEMSTLKSTSLLSTPPTFLLHLLSQKVLSIPWLTSSPLSLQKSPALPWKSVHRVYLVVRPKSKVCRALGQI